MLYIKYHLKIIILLSVITLIVGGGTVYAFRQFKSSFSPTPVTSAGNLVSVSAPSGPSEQSSPASTSSSTSSAQPPANATKPPLKSSTGTSTTNSSSTTSSGGSGSSTASSGSGGGTSTSPAAQSCPAYPQFPNASCTGVPAGTTLTPSGSITVTQAGAVLNGLDISGGVVIEAPNVTIKNCKIHGSGYYGVQTVSGNVTITDTEIYGFSEAAIGFDNWTGIRLNIHGMGSDGVKFGSNSSLTDSYIHDFATSSGAHADGGQMQAGETNITIRHNYINPLSGENSALFMAPDQGPSAAGPVVIDSNLLGGGNYTMYIVDGNNGQYHESGYSVTNNRFLRNAQYGPTDINEPNSSFTLYSGNVYDDNGAPV